MKITQKEELEEKKEAYLRFRRAVLFLFQSFTYLILSMAAGAVILGLIIIFTSGGK